MLSSTFSLPFAWITGPTTDPSYYSSPIMLYVLTSQVQVKMYLDVRHWMEGSFHAKTFGLLLRTFWKVVSQYFLDKEGKAFSFSSLAFNKNKTFFLQWWHTPSMLQMKGGCGIQKWPNCIKMTWKVRLFIIQMSFTRNGPRYWSNVCRDVIWLLLQLAERELRCTMCFIIQ